MVLYKAETGENAIVSQSKQKLIKLESVVYSYDKDVHELTLPICTVDNPAFFGSIKELMFLMTYTHNGNKCKYQGVPTHDGVKNVTVTIPQKLHGFNGRVTMSLYAILTTGQRLDMARYTFEMITSDIDTDLFDVDCYYFKRFEDILEQAQIRIDDIIDGIELDVQEQLDEIKAKVDSVENEVNEFETTINKQMDGIQTNVTDFKKDVNSQLVVIKDHVTDVETQINSTLSILQSKVGSMESDINSLDEELNKLKTQVTTLQGTINTLTTKVTELQSQVGGIETTVTELEARIAQIEVDLSALLVDYYTKTQVDTKLDLKADVSKAQMNKVTADNGERFGTITSGAILDTIVGSAGVKSYVSTNGASDHPSGTYGFRFISNMTDAKNGYVIGVADSGKVYNRNISNGNWIGFWGELTDKYTKAEADRALNLKADVSKAQMTKITSDTGNVIATIGSGQSLLDYILAKGLGFYTLRASSASSDTPKIGQTFSAIVQCINQNGSGNVTLISDGGRVFTRTFFQGAWYTNSQWEEQAFVSKAQMQQITLDTGERKATFSNADTLLSDSMALGAGVHNVAVTGDAITGLGVTGALRGLFIRNVSAFGNYLLADDGGNVFARGVNNGAWGGAWKKYTSEQDIMNLLNGGVIPQTYTKDFNGKVAGSVTANPNRARYTASPTIVTPTTTMTEFAQNGYDYLKALDGQRFSNLNTIDGNVMQVIIDWDIVSMVAKEYPNYFSTRGALTLAQKVAVLRTDITSMTPRVYAYGNGDGGFKLTTQLWNGDSSVWSGTVTNTTDQYSEMKYNIASTNNKLYLTDDGKIYMLLYANPTGNGVNSQFYLDYADFTYTLRSRVPVGQKVPVTMDDGRSKLTISSDLQDNLLSLGAGVHSVICMPAVMNGLTPQAVRGILTLNTATYGSFTGVDDSGRVFYINMNAGVLGSWRILSQPPVSGNITLATGHQAYSGQQPKYTIFTNNDGSKTIHLSGIIQKTGGTDKFVDGTSVLAGTIPTSAFSNSRNRILSGTSDGSNACVSRVSVLANSNDIHIGVRGGDTTFVSLEGLTFIV